MRKRLRKAILFGFTYKGVGRVSARANSAFEPREAGRQIEGIFVAPLKQAIPQWFLPIISTNISVNQL
jgi:hypothetical protein